MSEQHRHQWITETKIEECVPRFVCTECTATALACNTCGAVIEGELSTCAPCIERARDVLADIREAADVPMMREVLGIRAVRYDAEPGGGSGREGLPFGIGTNEDDPEDVQRRADALGKHVIQIMRDPANVLAPLHGWAREWADTRREAWSGNVLDYLASMHLWASQSPDRSGWLTYLEEARLVRNRIRSLAGLSPRYETAPCTHCGGDIIQENTETGLSDVRRCTGCGMEWGNRERLDFTSLTYLLELPSKQPDMIVTLEQARTVLPTARRNTINVAIHRDRRRAERGEARRIPEVGTDVRGRPLYRIGDIASALGLVQDGVGDADAATRSLHPTR